MMSGDFRGIEKVEGKCRVCEDPWDRVGWRR